MTDWKPIETAPRDGTHCLLCLPFDVGPLIVGYYRYWSSPLVPEGWTSYPDNRPIPDRYAPTHWTELPRPPIGEE